MANEVARAYVLIVPSMEGARGAISDELNGAGEEAGRSAGSRAGSAFSGALGAAARVGAVAVSAVATGVGAITAQAVNSYADFEQLSGGIETLYGESSAQMMQYAQEAAQATGQDMNSYMESAIATSAAMISAVEGDQARAAELTNQAMIDMADNANKLGTNMESIQDAYRGFSRGNFTMLDNLALGYAGTAQGMQQLLADAQAISGVEYDISSYSDIVEAIHVVQDEMGIAGTTATEASQTVTGSLMALGASWENLLINFANPDANLSAMIGQLIANVEVAAGNLIPVISNALMGISQVIVQLAPVIAAELPGLVQNIVPPLLSAAGSILEALAQGLLLALPTLAPIAAELILSLVEFTVSNLGLVVESAIQIILAVVNGLTAALPNLIPAAVNAVIEICMALTNPDTLILLVEAALQLMLALAGGLIAAIPDLLAAVPEIGANLIEALVGLTADFLDIASDWGADIIEGLVNGILGGISYVQDAVSSVASTIRDFIGFSEPERGPLSNFHTYMPDMFDLLEEGIEDGAPGFEATLNSSLAIPALGSSAIGAYEPSVNSDSGNIVIPVSIGQERLDTIMIRSSQISTYRRGG